MNEQDRLIKICISRLQELDLYKDEYKKRLQLELQEIAAQNEQPYLLSLYDKKSQFPENENNLLVPFLLGLVKTFDISKEPKWNYGEFPDIDIDYLPDVRDYLKEQFAKEQFGEEHVCNISNYNTFGMRSALIDMARIFGKDRNEIIKITKTLAAKDDEGETMTWEKAVEVYDDLKEYADKNPEVADAARRLMHRNRSQGQHASGLIISSVPIHGFVPLVRGKEGSPASAWVEGLHGTDLGAVGLVKFDFLSLDGNMKIALAAKMAGNIENCYTANQICKVATDNLYKPICALPGNPSSWSDTSYLDDKKALEMANRGDLKMIFQFDGSPGIRRLAEQGGVSSFDDLVAYTALFRPGPMKLGYHSKYCNRKRGKEKFEIHPLLANFMSSTYGVLTYQEQIMRLLNIVGNVPLKDCETVRKAISKKKVDKFKIYKEAFVENGQKLLGWTQEEMEHMWDQIEAFAGYGFNLSHAVAYTYISSRMLWLKCHYPKEFYAAVFTEVKAAGPEDYAKLKDYKQEAEKHGCPIQPLDLNKSGAAFRIIDGKIYYGFAKIKGIGDEAAIRIEKKQPYTGLMDFLSRFGTEQKIVQALIGLDCFKEKDHVTLYKFYKVYKDFEKKQNERRKRFENSKKNILEQIKENGDSPYLQDKLRKTIANFDKKSQFIEVPKLDTLSPENVELDEEEFQIMNNQGIAEMSFYGFVWKYPLEKCEGYKGQTFEKFIEEGQDVNYVETFVADIKEVQGKKTTYYQATLEDAKGESNKVNIWQADYKQFKKELQKGNCVRFLLQAPKEPYPTYSLVSFPRGKKPNKDEDPRVKVLFNG